MARRAISLMVLAGDESLRTWCVANLDSRTIDRLEDLRDEAQAKLKEPISGLIARARIHAADRIVREVQKQHEPDTGHVARLLSRWTMHPFWGLFFVLFVLFCFYQFVGKFGAGTLVDFFQSDIFEEYMNPAVEKTVKALVRTVLRLFG